MGLKWQDNVQVRGRKEGKKEEGRGKGEKE